VRLLACVLEVGILPHGRLKRAQRHMNVVNFTEPVEGPFTVLCSRSRPTDSFPRLWEKFQDGHWEDATVVCHSEGDKARVRTGALRSQRRRILGQAIKDRLGWVVGWMC
jgi:hypothetical protein